MIYVRPAWELAADSRLLKLRRLLKQVFRRAANFQGADSAAICRQHRHLHVALKIPHVYDMVKKYGKACRNEKKSLNENFGKNGQRKFQH